MKLKPIFINKNREFITEINSIKRDIDKITEFERINPNKKPFIIVDKSKSQAFIYDNDKISDTFEIGVGKTFGDDLNTVQFDFTKRIFSDTGNTTPPGLFVTQKPYSIYSAKDYTSQNGQINVLPLRGVQHPVDYKQNTTIALHQISNDSQDRLEMLTQSGRKSMSNGCINFAQKDFERLKAQINESGTNVYILPEEKGNSLELVQLDNGVWFKPHYQNEEKANIFENAFKKFFGLNK